MLSVALLALGVGAFYINLKAGRFRTVPVEEFLLFGAAVLVAVVTTIRQPSLVNVLISVLSVITLVAYGVATIGWRYPRSGLAIETGNAFPDFQLPDSQGRSLRFA